jgi:hypothetical protein
VRRCCPERHLTPLVPLVHPCQVVRQDRWSLLVPQVLALPEALALLHQRQQAQRHVMLAGIAIPKVASKYITYLFRDLQPLNSAYTLTRFTWPPNHPGHSRDPRWTLQAWKSSTRHARQAHQPFFAGRTGRALGAWLASCPRLPAFATMTPKPLTSSQPMSNTILSLVQSSASGTQCHYIHCHATHFPFFADELRCPSYLLLLYTMNGKGPISPTFFIA